MSKMIDLVAMTSDISMPATQHANYQKHKNEYYIDQEFFTIDPTAANEYNRRISELAEYTQYAENHYDLNDYNMRIKIFSSLSYALRKAGEAEAWASFLYNNAETKCDEAEAIAALDDFEDYVTSAADQGKEVKSTEKVRQWYIQKNPRVLQAKRTMSMAKAIQTSISIYRLQFSKALDTIKAFSYGAPQARQISSLDHTKEL